MGLCCRTSSGRPSHQWGLSPQELKIAPWLLTGEKEWNIARIGMARGTVHTHLHRMYAKLGVNSRMEAVIAILRDYVGHTCPPTFLPCAGGQSSANRAA